MMTPEQREPTTDELVKLTDDLLARSRQLLEDLDEKLDGRHADGRERRSA